MLFVYFFIIHTQVLQDSFIYRKTILRLAAVLLVENKQNMKSLDTTAVSPHQLDV